MGYYQPPPQGYGPQPAKKSSGLAVAGGALILIAGILGLIMGVMMFFIGGWMDSIYGMYDMDMEDYYFIFYICGAVLLIFSIFALLGGVMAITKKSFGFAVMGGVFGLLCIGPYFLASILGLIGLVLVIVGRQDFEGQRQSEPQYGYAPPPPGYQQPPVYQAQPQQMRYCTGCGKQIAANYSVCPYCGRPLN